MRAWQFESNQGYTASGWVGNTKTQLLEVEVISHGLLSIKYLQNVLFSDKSGDCMGTMGRGRNGGSDENTYSRRCSFAALDYAAGPSMFCA